MNINCQPPLQFVYFSTDTHIPWISHNTLRDRLFKNGVAIRKKVYYPRWELSRGQLSGGGGLSRGQLSGGGDYPGGNYPRWELSGGIIQRAIILGVNCPGGGGVSRGQLSQVGIVWGGGGIIQEELSCHRPKEKVFSFIYLLALCNVHLRLEIKLRRRINN